MASIGALQGCSRAAHRAAAAEELKLQRCQTSLASIAATAPLVGAFESVFWLANSFSGSASEKSATLWGLFWRLSHTLEPAALGLVVAIFAWLCLQYLRSRTDELALEMELASSDLQSLLLKVRS